MTGGCSTFGCLEIVRYKAIVKGIFEPRYRRIDFPPQPGTQAFNIQEITKGAVFGKVKEKNFDTGEEKTIELPASQSPTLQIIAKDKMDEMNVMKVFQFADRVVQHLFVMLSQNKTI